MAGSIKIREIRKIQKINPKYKNIKYFIETGTYKGDTTFHLCKYFDSFITIELYKKWYDLAKQKAKKHNITNVKFYKGDSAIVLPKIIKDIYYPIIYFLDGHFCGAGTDSASGDEIPLLGELKSINKLRNTRDIIIIDDFRMFHNQKIKYKNKEYWSKVTIESVIKCFNRGKIHKYSVHNDRFIIYLQKQTKVYLKHKLIDCVKPTFIRYSNKIYLTLVKLVPKKIRKKLGKISV